MVAVVLNGLLHELITANTIGTEIKPRADVAVIGYGSGRRVGSALAGSLRRKRFVSLPELVASPLRVDVRKRKEVDDAGSIIEVDVPFPVWVKPKARNGTPMCAALHEACKWAEEWVASHPENYPPVVINVTDGASTDGDPTGPASDLRSVGTSDGQTLLFNCHISEGTHSTTEFPVHEHQVPQDQYARLLFSLSSVIPESARANILSNTGISLLPGARGFIYNGDAGSVRQMFIFATVGAQSIDVHR